MSYLLARNNHYTQGSSPKLYVALKDTSSLILILFVLCSEFIWKRKY